MKLLEINSKLFQEDLSIDLVDLQNSLTLVKLQGFFVFFFGVGGYSCYFYHMFNVGSYYNKFMLFF